MHALTAIAPSHPSWVRRSRTVPSEANERSSQTAQHPPLGWYASSVQRELLGSCVPAPYWVGIQWSSHDDQRGFQQGFSKRAKCTCISLILIDSAGRRTADRLAVEVRARRGLMQDR